MNIFSYFSKKPGLIKVLAGPFKDASLILNPACSKRKIFGIYEYVLNPWLNQVLPQIQVVWDVGANDGYFTYGCAHVSKQYHQEVDVVAFEPSLNIQPNLLLPAQWKQYSDVTFEFIPLFVGAISNESTITLNEAYEKRYNLHHKPSLIKVDVEGAEIEVLNGATKLLERPNHWVVEVHGDHLLEPVLNIFAQVGREVDIHYLKPHWLFGAEQRTIKTSWVTTRIK